MTVQPAIFLIKGREMDFYSLNKKFQKSWTQEGGVMEKASAEIGVSSPEASKGISGYLINKLQNCI